MPISLGSLIRNEGCPRRLSALLKYPGLDRLGVKELALQEFILLSAQPNCSAESAMTQAYNHHKMELDEWLDFSNLAFGVKPLLSNAAPEEHSLKLKNFGEVVYQILRIDDNPCVLSLERDEKDTKLARFVSALIKEDVKTYFIRYKEYARELEPPINLLEEIDSRAATDDPVPGYGCNTCPVVQGCPALDVKPQDKFELSAAFFVHMAASKDARERLRQILLLEGPQSLTGADWFFDTKKVREVPDAKKMLELLEDKAPDYVKFEAAKIEKDFKMNLEVLRQVKTTDKHSVSYRRKK